MNSLPSKLFDTVKWIQGRISKVKFTSRNCLINFCGISSWFRADISGPLAGLQFQSEPNFFMNFTPASFCNLCSCNLQDLFLNLDSAFKSVLTCQTWIWKHGMQMPESEQIHASTTQANANLKLLLKTETSMSVVTGLLKKYGKVWNFS